MKEILRPNRQQGTTYTIQVADAGEQMVECDDTDPFVLLVPSNDDIPFENGSVVEIVQTGDGQVTVTPATGVTVIVNSELTTSLRGKGSMAALYKSAADTRFLTGHLEASA
jgi:hypothetical protein